MHPDAADMLVAWAERIDQLIADGILPDSKYLFPRFFSVGHRLVHGWDGAPYKYKCVQCMRVWETSDYSNTGHCHDEDDTFRLNYNWRNHWRCLACRHEWDGEDGEVCPSCKVIWWDCGGIANSDITRND